MHSIIATAQLMTVMAFAMLAALPVVARAQNGFVLIVNAANPLSALSRDDVSRLFLLKRTRWSFGERARPVDQAESSPVRRKFSESVHRMDVPNVKGFWQEIVFSGRGEPPPERASDGDVVAFVKANRGAIGYVTVGATSPGVKIIAVTP